MQNARYSSLKSTISDQTITLSRLHSHAASHQSTWEDGRVPRQLKSRRPLGVEASKRYIDWIDVLVTLGSWTACAAAIAVVVNEYAAWHLGVTYQLVLVGLLLSVMNLCLKYVAPTVFLQWEARFGASTLQNYEALLRNRAFTSKADWGWRTSLVLLAILPLGLSAAYKLFVGGFSTLAIGEKGDLYSNSFGTYAPPGMQPLGANSGMILMNNATIPFIEATSTPDEALLANHTYGDPVFDLALPVWPKPYGFNTLVLNETATALLDAPPPRWVKQVQNVLKPGESWNISATVTATISTYNSSVEAHRHEYYPPPDDPDRNSTFWDFYNWQGGMKWSTMYNGWNIGIISNEAVSSTRDQSWCFLGIFPDPRNDNLTTFAPVAKMYSLRRMPCNGTWTVTRGGIQLTGGMCDLEKELDDAQYDRDQLVLRNNQFFLGGFLPLLQDYLAPYATARNQSHWLEPTMATVVASMVWSKLTALNGPGSTVYRPLRFDIGNGTSFSYTDIGLLYESRAAISSTRPTLKRSVGLFVLFAIQPVITLGILIVGRFMRSVPIGKGFGLVAVLAGVDRKSLDTLEGAEFSGKLKRKVPLSVFIDDETGRVVYAVDESSTKLRGRNTTLSGLQPR
ncbi:hypothetical protein PRZ48_011805 [Zasmidium cellare]|uniref:Uncharacterized protein n=1 Tax=Zasmidium cellare TaxID=395010 RepID=A0ABR0E7Q3_ZASCE|nr:hypothetical protein PRZ48_011805 [Zasmidium cellare]